MRVFLTGGTGYIGSHTAVELLRSGHEVLLYDNLSNSDISVVDGIYRICGIKPSFVKGDVTDEKSLTEAMRTFKPHAVIHFAGLKSVKRSVSEPLSYYRVNVGGITVLLGVMAKLGVNNLIFSSSATVYDARQNMPVGEDGIVGNAANPYGETKIICEQLIADVCKCSPLNATVLRYFNPIGAHPSGLIGEKPDYPDNLAPYVTDVVLGKREFVGVFGDDYPTVDGTGVRDYIHVCDLAQGHVLALNNMQGLKTYNLGTGVGSSVLQVIAAFSEAVGYSIPYKILPRRDGDVACLVALADKAKRELNFCPKYNLSDMALTCIKYARKVLSE